MLKLTDKNTSNAPLCHGGHVVVAANTDKNFHSYFYSPFLFTALQENYADSASSCSIWRLIVTVRWEGKSAVSSVQI